MTVLSVDVHSSVLPHCAPAVGWQAFRAEMDQLFERFAAASAAPPLPRIQEDALLAGATPTHAASR